MDSSHNRLIPDKEPKAPEHHSHDKDEDKDKNSHEGSAGMLQLPFRPPTPPTTISSASTSQPPTAPKHGFLYNKISGVLGYAGTKASAVLQPLGKIASALTRSPTTPAPVPTPGGHDAGHSDKPNGGDSKPAPKKKGLFGWLGTIIWVWWLLVKLVLTIVAIWLLGKISRMFGAKHPGTFVDKIDNALGGGAIGEHKEDFLDKAIDYVQEHVLHQGPQDNESAPEQLKDRLIANLIKGLFKTVTGKVIPGK